MNEMTSFIAKMMALYLLVTGIGFFVSREFYLRMINDAQSEHPISINLSGMVHFFIGMAILLNHFYWSTHLEVAVSLIGMAFLLKGGLLIMVPGTILKSNQFSMKILPLSGIGFIAAGLYLIWALYV
ncbi:hypothetical protein [Gimesia aquarii]|uniref:Uncharacterized protein n=1 Tax=Gimesia aquarii TaxID=2527964 RepID=A0A517W2K3_9PLAN|nr:hypothetical protein [Gimesia aquarii]QDT99485.1 hypothetical protein V144x_49960 [Gimesia aquarii]